MSEVAALKISDIDSSRMVLRIERGKGGKRPPDDRLHTPAGCETRMTLSRFPRPGRKFRANFPTAHRLPEGNGCIVHGAQQVALLGEFTAAICAADQVLVHLRVPPRQEITRGV